MKLKANNRLFIKNYLEYFVRPGRTFAILQKDKRRVRQAVFAVLIPAIGYTLMYLLAWLAGGAPSSFKPWLAIPIEQYFKWDILIVAPSMLLCWIAASGVVQLFSRFFSGSGSFEDTSTVVAFGIGIATWSTLIHDLTDAVLGATGVIDMKAYESALNGPTFWRGLLWTLFLIYFVWFILLFTIGFRKAYGIGIIKSLILAFIGLIIYQGMFLVFNR